MKAAIVVTSINDCVSLIDGYRKNFAKYGREAKIFLIPDVKTPVLIGEPVICPTLSEQSDFLKRIGYPPSDIPRNSDNRRNVGYLMALADGAEMIVSIDDDNYCPENEDFIMQHSGPMTYFCPSTDTKWVNNCDLLFREYTVYPRGFPYFARSYRKVEYPPSMPELPVYINAGLWVSEPDFDAITWLSNPPSGATYSRDIALGYGAWCPINSQNTAVHRDLMPAYYFIRMIPPNDRFGDIFQGYFALKVAKHMGWTARFGSPVVTHRRNSHVYLKDVQKEIEPILLLEELLPKLIKHKLTGTTVHEVYLTLADFVESQDTEFYRGTARLMRQWAETVRRIGC